MKHAPHAPDAPCPTGVPLSAHVSIADALKPLYWNADGMVNCADHIPFIGSDTWVREGWRLMTSVERDGWLATVGTPPTCEICR